MPAPHRERALAKLTRTLAVTGRRSDGYHLLDSQMCTLDLADDLEISEGSGLEVVDGIDWTLPGGEALAVPRGPTNLVAKALALAGRQAHVRLVKRIPPGAGLGGGSADAAAVLRWAGLLDPQVAARLGADVPFCLRGGHARVRGIGELVEPLADLAATFVLVTPEFGVSTAAVYARYDEVGASGGPNDLARAAIALEPRLGAVRDRLGAASGLEPRLAGSGGTWFVEVDDERGADVAGEVRSAFAAAGARVVVTLGRTVGALAREEVERGSA